MNSNKIVKTSGPIDWAHGKVLRYFSADITAVTKKVMQLNTKMEPEFKKLDVQLSEAESNGQHHFRCRQLNQYHKAGYALCNDAQSKR